MNGRQFSFSYIYLRDHTFKRRSCGDIFVIKFYGGLCIVTWNYYLNLKIISLLKFYMKQSGLLRVIMYKKTATKSLIP